MAFKSDEGIGRWCMNDDVENLENTLDEIEKIFQKKCMPVDKLIEIAKILIKKKS